MHWFGEGPQTESESRANDARDRGYSGWLDEHGHAVASRTDPGDGQALPLKARGSMGHGTADEKRARGLGRGKR